MHHKWQSYNAWFLTYEAWQTEFVLILGHFLPFYPTNNPKNQNFKKIKKAHGYIIILHKCTKNHDHMLYCSWDMACNRCNLYFSFWAIFCPFTSLTARKNHLEISYDTCVPKIMITWCMVPEIVCDGQTDRQTDGQLEKVTYRGDCLT